MGSSRHFHSTTSFVPRSNRNGTTTRGQYSSIGITSTVTDNNQSSGDDLSEVIDAKLDKSAKINSATIDAITSDVDVTDSDIYLNNTGVKSLWTKIKEMFASKIHAHSQSDVTGLTDALSGKANSTHTHSQSDVTGLTDALSSKANINHNHVKSEISDFSHNHNKSDLNDFYTLENEDVDLIVTSTSYNADDYWVSGTILCYFKEKLKSMFATKIHSHTKSQITDFTHTHAQSDVTGLTDALSGKANSTHTHSQSDITGLTDALSGKANSTHSHSINEVISLKTTLDNKAAKSEVVKLTTAQTVNGAKTFTDLRASNGLTTMTDSSVGANISISEEGNGDPVAALYYATNGGGSLTLKGIIGGVNARSASTSIYANSNVVPYGSSVYDALQDKADKTLEYEYGRGLKRIGQISNYTTVGTRMPLFTVDLNNISSYADLTLSFVLEKVCTGSSSDNDGSVVLHYRIRHNGTYMQLLCNKKSTTFGSIKVYALATTGTRKLYVYADTNQTYTRYVLYYRTHSYSDYTVDFPINLSLTEGESYKNNAIETT